MADISKIKLPSGTTYNIKDRISRSHYLYLDSTTKVLLIGDSYNNGVGGTSGHGWGYYFQQMTNCDATIVHQNGGGFAAVGNSNATYPSKTHAQCITSISASSFDVVIAQAGWNDSSTDRNPNGVSAIVNGVNTFISNVKTKWPNAEIVIIPTNNDTEINQYKRQCLDAISGTALLNGIKSSKYSIFWMRNSGYSSSDGIHLVDAGYQMLASLMVSFIRGWDGIVSHTARVPLTDVSGSGITVGQNLLEVYRNENWAFISGDVTLTATLSSWTTLVSGLPIPVKNVAITTSQWDSNVIESGAIDTYVIRRNIRAEIATDGILRIRYGSPGNYRITINYPIANE